MKPLSAIVLSLVSASTLHASMAYNPSYDLVFNHHYSCWTFRGLLNYHCSIEEFNPLILGSEKSTVFSAKSNGTANLNALNAMPQPNITRPLKLSCINLANYSESGEKIESKSSIAVITSFIQSLPDIKIQSLHFSFIHGFVIGTHSLSKFIEKYPHLKELSLPRWILPEFCSGQEKDLQFALSKNDSIEYLTLTQPTCYILHGIAERKATLKKLSLLELDYNICQNSNQPIEYITQTLIDNYSSLQVLEVVNSYFPLDITGLYTIMSMMGNLTRLSVSIDSEKALREFCKCKFISQKLQSLTVKFAWDKMDASVFAGFLASHLTITELIIKGLPNYTWVNSLGNMRLNLTSFPIIDASMWPYLNCFLRAAPGITSLRLGQDHRLSATDDNLANFLRNNGTVTHLIWDGPIDNKFIAAVVSNQVFRELEVTCSQVHVTQAQIDRLKERYPNLQHRAFSITPTSDQFEMGTPQCRSNSYF